MILFPLVVFITAFLLRLAYFVQFDTWAFLSDICSDPFMHFQLALNLVNHHSFFFESPENPNFTDYSGTAVSFYLAPFLWLKGIYPGLYFAKLGLIVIGSLSAVIVYALAHQLFKNRWAALASGILFTANPLSITETTLIMNDTLSLFFFLGTMLLLTRILNTKTASGWQVFFLGILTGLTAIARYVYVSLFPVVFLSLLLRPRKTPIQQRARRLILLSLAFLLTFGSWMARNWLIKKGPDPSKFLKSMKEYAAPFLTGEMPKENVAAELARRYRNFYFTPWDAEWLRGKIRQWAGGALSKAQAEDPHRAGLFLFAAAGLAAWALRYRQNPGVLPLLFFMLIYPLILITRYHLHARYRLPLITSYCVLSGGAIALLLDWGRLLLEKLRVPANGLARTARAASVFIPLLIVVSAAGETKNIFAKYRRSDEKIQGVAGLADKNGVILTLHNRNPWKIHQRTGLPVIYDFARTPFLVHQIPWGTQAVRELWRREPVEAYLKQEIFGQNKRAYVLGEDYWAFRKNLLDDGAPYSHVLINSKYELKLAKQDSQNPKFQLFELVAAKKE